MIHLLHLKSHGIFEQLQIEELLLRTDTRNWCLINESAASPAIVMGISGKPEELIDTKRALEYNIPVIKRFSGGGTVIVDEETLFVTFLFQKETHPFPSFPEPIMRWTESLYRAIFPSPLFHLRENDYVIDQKKCGGNAQYIRKDRWLHHSSFLWDFKPHHMSTLLHPKRTPTYRQDRAHDAFLYRLKELIPNKQLFVNALKAELSARYSLQETTLEEVRALHTPHRQETAWLQI